MSKDKTSDIKTDESSFFSFSNHYATAPQRMKSLFDVQLENISTLSEIQKEALENFQEIAERQREVFSQIMQHTSFMANDVFENAEPETKLKKNINLINSNYETTLKSVKEISELLHTSNVKASKILTARAKKSLEEIKINPTTKTA